MAGRTPDRRVPQTKQISPELSALAVYCSASRLRALCPAPAPAQPCQVSSVCESKAKKLIREAGRSGTGHRVEGQERGQGSPESMAGGRKHCGPVGTQTGGAICWGRPT